MNIKLLDGLELSDVKVSIEFSLGDEAIVVHLEGEVIENDEYKGGLYSDTMRLEDLSSIFGEDDLAKVKFILGKMNGMIRIK